MSERKLKTKSFLMVLIYDFNYWAEIDLGGIRFQGGSREPLFWILLLVLK